MRCIGTAAERARYGPSLLSLWTLAVFGGSRVLDSVRAEVVEAGVSQTSTPSRYALTRELESDASDVKVRRSVRLFLLLDSRTTCLVAMPQRNAHEWMCTGWLMKC